jgi:chromosome segregation ATPase
MKTKRLFFTVMLLVGAASIALAQRGGHHGNGGFGNVGHDQSKVQATEEQRTQLRTCSELSERLRMLAADMENPSNLSATDLGRVRQQWNGLLLQAMQGDHQAFLGSLDADQQAALKDRLRKMDKAWSELASRFEIMDRDLTQTAPDARLLAGHAKELEKSLKKWQKQHRELESQMGVKG